jgi:hypothetical protein
MKLLAGGALTALLWILLPGRTPSVEEYADVPAFARLDAIYSLFDTIRTPLSDYIWPTNVTNVITSTFGEFRRTHFHAGIDISTGNTTGHKVFASRDGYVWRVWISPTGYGKILYIRHSDGYTTAYAHLKYFPEPLNGLVIQEQQRLERYPVDILFDSTAMPVRRGEVVAYSGSTGSGGPHLHFEIRDENLNPINPLLSGNIRVEDHLPPSIHSVAFIPLDNNTTVDGKNRYSIINKFAVAKGHISIPRPVGISGRVGIAVSARDRIPGTYHRVGVHRLELHVNDSLIFSSSLDRLPAEESKQILIFYSLPLLKKGRGRFQQLFVAEGSTLPVYGRLPHGSGIIDSRIMQGKQRIRIVCKDVHGNSTELTGDLLLTSPPPKTPSLVSGNDPEGYKEEIFRIPPDEAGWFSFDNDAVQVWYDSGAVFTSLNFSVGRVYEDTATVYRLRPHDVLLNRGIRLFIRPSRASNKMAIYSRENHRWEMQKTEFDSSTGYYGTTLSMTLSDVALLEDRVPPQISSLTISSSGRKPRAAFRMHDVLSGIDGMEIKTYIDDQFVVPEVDERWRVECVSTEALERGDHVFRIKVRDRAGNATELVRPFTIP